MKKTLDFYNNWLPFTALQLNLRLFKKRTKVLPNRSKPSYSETRSIPSNMDLLTFMDHYS